MSQHPNLARVRNLYAMVAAGQVTAALEHLADDAVFHFNSDGPLGGDHKGRDAIVKVLVATAELTGGSQKLAISNIFADDQHAIVVLRETATRTDGASLDVDEVHLLTFDPGGKITTLWDIPSDPDVHDAFFAGR